MTEAASVPIIIRVITSKVSTNSTIEVREASEEDTTTEIIEVTIEITEVMINITNGKEEVIEMIIGGKIEGGIITTEEIIEIMMKTPSQIILMAKIPDPLSTVKKSDPAEMIIGGKIEGGIITTEETIEIMMKTQSPVILMAKIPDPLSIVRKSDPAATGGRQNPGRRGSLVLMKL